jgi:hypothetical protein
LTSEASQPTNILYRSYRDVSGNQDIDNSDAGEKISFAVSPDLGNATEVALGIALDDDGSDGTNFEKTGSHEYLVLWQVEGIVEDNRGSSSDHNEGTVLVQPTFGGNKNVAEEQAHWWHWHPTAEFSGDQTWTMSGHGIIEDDDTGDTFLTCDWSADDETDVDIEIVTAQITFIRMAVSSS